MNVYQRMVAKLQMNKEIIAKEWDIIPNPDFIHRKKIEEAIKNNDGHCCCALEKTEDTLCMCKDFREQNHSGFCHCGRYYKVVRSPKVCSGDEDVNEIQKEYLDEIHKAKIADADVVYIINCDNYIGKSTRSEINWATELGKKIEYLEK